MNYLVPNSGAGLNIGILEQIEKGKKIIAEAGGEIAYDIEARKKHKEETMKNELLKEHENIIFGSE